MKVLSAGGLTIHAVALGDLATNGYVLVCGGAGDSPACGAGPNSAHTGETPVLLAMCWVVDPAGPVGPLLQLLRKNRLSPQRILLTHGHGDHISGVAELRGHFPDARITAPAGDADMLASPLDNLSLAFGMRITCPPADQLVSHGDSLPFGPLAWEVLDTSGHTPGGVSYYCRAAGAVLTGDALFADGIGRTDLPGGSEQRLLENIHRRLLTLPDETVVLPGHGPTTTIGHERRHNPFLTRQEGQGR